MALSRIVEITFIGMKMKFTDKKNIVYSIIIMYVPYQVQLYNYNLQQR